MLDSIPEDIFHIISTKLKVKDLLILRRSCKNLNKHDINYYVNLKDKEYKFEILKYALLKKVAKNRCKNLFLKKVMSDISFRKKYITIYKDPVHLCFYNHQLTPFTQKLFKSVNEIAGYIMLHIQDNLLTHINGNSNQLLSIDFSLYLQHQPLSINYESLENIYYYYTI